MLEVAMCAAVQFSSDAGICGFFEGAIEELTVCMATTPPVKVLLYTACHDVLSHYKRFCTHRMMHLLHVGTTNVTVVLLEMLLVFSSAKAAAGQYSCDSPDAPIVGCADGANKELIGCMAKTLAVKVVLVIVGDAATSGCADEAIMELIACTANTSPVKVQGCARECMLGHATPLKLAWQHSCESSESLALATLLKLVSGS